MGKSEAINNALEWLKGAGMYAEGESEPPAPARRSAAKANARRRLKQIIEELDTLTDEGADAVAEAATFALLEASNPGRDYVYFEPKPGRPAQGNNIYILPPEVLEACREIMQIWIECNPKKPDTIMPILGYLLNDYLATECQPIGKIDLLNVLNMIAPDGLECNQKNFNRLTRYYEQKVIDNGHPGKNVAKVAGWMEAKWPELFNNGLTPPL